MSDFVVSPGSKADPFTANLMLIRFLAGLCLCIPIYVMPSRAETPLQCSGLELVSLNKISPRPLFEIRYASSNNFLGQTLYPKVDHNYVVPWPWHYKTCNKILPRKDLD